MTMIPCPLCTGHATRNVYQSDAAFLGNMTHDSILFTLELCLTCGFVYQSSAYQPEYQSLMSQAYAKYDVNSHFPFPDRSEKNTAPLERILAYGRPGHESPSILEIGSNRGDLLYLLKERLPQANILGLEPTNFNNLSVPTVHANFRADLFSNRFDIIIMKHVLEHLPYPRSVATDLFHRLNPGGILYIEVPDLQLSLEHGAEDFVPDHVSYFTGETLADCLDQFAIIHQDRSNFLSVVATHRLSTDVREVRQSAPSTTLLTDHFVQFDADKKRLSDAIVTHAKGGGSIIFYGISYYFNRLFKELLNQGLPRERCFHFDDNFQGTQEPGFGLPRLSPFADDGQSGAMIVLCSNNFRVQKQMATHLIHGGFQGHLLYPWSNLVPNAGQPT
ncbi:MAG: class I SAM-dependent methyltransferase [Magnetococcales bacterium]|nr:class I SAM-dependent methyltransferase [Magnetococcales bacterium]